MPVVEVGERGEGGQVLEDGDKENMENHHERGGEDAHAEDGLELLEEWAVAVKLPDAWQRIITVASANDRGVVQFSGQVNVLPVDAERLQDTDENSEDQVGRGEAGGQDVVGEVELLLSDRGDDQIDIEDNGEDSDEDEEGEESGTLADGVYLLLETRHGDGVKLKLKH